MLRFCWSSESRCLHFTGKIERSPPPLIIVLLIISILPNLCISAFSEWNNLGIQLKAYTPKNDFWIDPNGSCFFTETNTLLFLSHVLLFIWKCLLYGEGDGGFFIFPHKKVIISENTECLWWLLFLFFTWDLS